MQKHIPKKKAERGPAAVFSPQAVPEAPNSVQLMGTLPQEDESVYADALKAKFMEHQLPSAEREADRIAAGIHASTPEQVKEQLGEKMGADFSDVRFHTDGAAAGQADTIGARAFTTGRDVYFGQGGFDAGVAAHELVHTVQQGSVDAEMGTLSAPAGEVQMLPKWLKKLVGRDEDAENAQQGGEEQLGQQNADAANQKENVQSAPSPSRRTKIRNFLGFGESILEKRKDKELIERSEADPEEKLALPGGGTSYATVPRGSKWSQFWAWAKHKTIGSLKRKHKRAFNDIMDHKSNKKGKRGERGDYYDMKLTDRLWHGIKNPLATMHSWGADKDRWRLRHEAKELERKKLMERYLEKNGVRQGDRYVMNVGQTFWELDAEEAEQERLQEKLEQALENKPEETLAEKLKDPAVGIAGIGIEASGSATDWFGSLAKSQMDGSHIKHRLGTQPIADVLGLAQRAAEVKDSINKIKEAKKVGIKGKVTNEAIGLVENGISALKGVGDTMENVADVYGTMISKGSERAQKILSYASEKDFGFGNTITGIAGGAASAVNAIKGIHTLKEAHGRKNQIKDFQDELGEEDGDGENYMQGEKNKLRMLSNQGERAATHDQIKGGIEIGKGAIGVGAAAVPSATAKSALSLLKTVVGVAGDKYLEYDQHKMDDKVLKEDMPHLEEEIQGLTGYFVQRWKMKHLREPVNETTYYNQQSKAKQMILQAHGFGSGKRSEAAAYWVTKRGASLANTANGQTRASERAREKSRNLLEAMNVRRRADGYYSIDDAAERLGRSKEVSKIAESRESEIERILKEGRN